MESKTYKCDFIGYSQNIQHDLQIFKLRFKWYIFENLTKFGFQKDDTYIVCTSPSTSVDNENKHPNEFELRRSKGLKKETSFGQDFLIYLVEGVRNEVKKEIN